MRGAVRRSVTVTPQSTNPARGNPMALSLLCQAVHRGEMTKAEADRQLSYLRALRIRLLGDRVLQNVA